MMICPTYYVGEHKNDSFEDLIKKRDSLINDIKELEKIVYSKDKSDPCWHFCPGPDVRYQNNLEYLSELCKLLRDKYNSEIVWGEPFDADAL